MSFFVAPGPFAELPLEAAALLLGIVQLAEGVADFQAADEDLEALHPLGILFRLALVLRQRRDSQREVVDERRLDQVRFGDELEDLRDGLAVGRSGIVRDVGIRRVVAVHHGRNLLGAGEVLISGLSPAFSGQNLMIASRIESRWDFAEVNLVTVEVATRRAVHVARHLRQHLGGEVHHVVVVGVGQ